jgi:hypothetical protein
VRPTRYEIVVIGELSQRFAVAFEGMEVHADAGRTTITGWVVDQARLHALIDRVGELGLELLDVRVVEVDGGAGAFDPSTSSDTPRFSFGGRT